MELIIWAGRHVYPDRILTHTHWGEAGGSGWPKFGSVIETKGKIFKAVQEISITSYILGFLATTSGALQWLFFYLYYFFLLRYSM